MGKRNTTSHQEVILENEVEESFRGNNKRLRVSSPRDSAALTLLSLKREAVSFGSSPPTTDIQVPSTISVSKESTSLCSKSSATSVCCSITDDESTGSITAFPIAVTFPTKKIVAPSCLTPLRKPILCHLNQTKAVPKQASASTFELRPLRPPPRLPNFLVLSSYSPFTLPRKQEGKQ